MKEAANIIGAALMARNSQGELVYLNTSAFTGGGGGGGGGTDNSLLEDIADNTSVISTLSAIVTQLSEYVNNINGYFNQNSGSMGNVPRNYYYTEKVSGAQNEVVQLIPPGGYDEIVLCNTGTAVIYIRNGGAIDDDDYPIYPGGREVFTRGLTAIYGKCLDGPLKVNCIVRGDN